MKNMRLCLYIFLRFFVQDLARYYRKVESFTDIETQYECAAKVLKTWNSTLPKIRASTFSYQNKVLFNRMAQYNKASLIRSRDIFACNR